MTSLIPIRFGGHSRELAGLYQPAAPGGNGSVCALLCNPFGQEAIRSHRMFRVLADRLSRNGVSVLRFDYYGTGESAGEDHEGDLEVWTTDVLQARAELLHRSGSADCCWFGLRLGGSLAALATARMVGPPPRLVLWDPLVDGSGYLSDLARAHVEGAKASWGPRWTIEEGLRHQARVESETEALGFPLTDSLKLQLRQLTLTSFGAVKAARVTLFGSRGGVQLAGVDRALAASGREVTVKPIQAEIDWTTNEAMNSAIAPFEDIQNVAAAISGN